MRKIRTAQKGFTILEVMIVIAILGMMASLVVGNLMDSADEAKVQSTAIEIKNLESILDLYKLKAGQYPTTEQGLEALVSAPEIEPVPRNYPQNGFLDELPQDKWGNDYQLINPGEMGKFDLFSVGPDGEAGTEDDIGNWNVKDFL
ncbi:type II secretion system protein GspG [Psychrosphaera saromensis]|jgi:general secretion pathway protein G|uniref:Type II secretion system core protein G n=1 Tax=Psychrosphaera saromensis TaxID=716813 RepID=A0A2S7USF3_9GAMM|nr:type II secretion system major pseudopilin GspG [Psychrosphaera saromensis]PQJ52916.1 type II secretion system protein GspG [Psychrosphaera saromensis]GHB77932.1 type II secretion system protein GspG [Psychrosphaera saromensis]GLQ12929.1 type II secretion system protein GspG [Psychrosphaera saromensis]